MDLSKEGVSGRDFRGKVDRRKLAACTVLVTSFVGLVIELDCSESLGLRIDWARPMVGRLVGLVSGTKWVGSLPMGGSLDTGGGTWWSRCGETQVRKLRGTVDELLLPETTWPPLGLLSNRVLKEETLPVTTGEGDRFRKLIRFPVPVRPRNPLVLLVSPGSELKLVPGIDSCRFLSLRSGLGLGLRVFEKGVVHLGFGPFNVIGRRDSAWRCSKRSLVLLTEPWLARAKILRGFGLLVALCTTCSVWGGRTSFACKGNVK